MTDTNSVVLVGRATKDLELSYTSGGLAIGKFSIAVNKSFKQKDGSYKEEANFFDVTVFGKIGETLKQYLAKGTQVCINGELSQNSWSTNEGQKRSKVEVIANHVQLLGGKPSHANQTEAQRGYEQPQNNFTEQLPYEQQSIHF